MNRTETKDLHLYESGSGGELLKKNEDLVLSESLFQTVYIALFGGNIEASTLGNESEDEERFDWWANSLIFKDQPNKQLNSLTEKTLSSVTTNSSGRIKIENAVKSDLFFLQKIANFSVNVVILSEKKIRINIKLTEISNQSIREFQFIWNNARNEVITEIII